jgi:hypothetical protein
MFNTSIALLALIHPCIPVYCFSPIPWLCTIPYLTATCTCVSVFVCILHCCIPFAAFKIFMTTCIMHCLFLRWIWALECVLIYNIVDHLFRLVTLVTVNCWKITCMVKLLIICLFFFFCLFLSDWGIALQKLYTISTIFCNSSNNLHFVRCLILLNVFVYILHNRVLCQGCG